MSDPSLSHMVEVPSLLLSVFIDAFHDDMGLGEAWHDVWLDFQLGLLHMLGAMLSSSNVSGYVCMLLVGTLCSDCYCRSLIQSMTLQ